MLIKPEPNAVMPALVAAIRAGPDRRCPFAVYVLGTLGAPAVPELINLLKSNDDVAVPAGRCRCEGAFAIGPEARAAAGALTDAIADPDQELRGDAIEALGNIGPDAAPAIPALVRCLGDESWLIGDKAAQALGWIGANAVPALMEPLHSRDPEARRRAIKSLGNIGPNAAGALPDLIRALIDPDEEIRTAAAEAIGLVATGPEAAAAAPGLLAAFKDADRIVRKTAAEALGKIGGQARSALGPLRERLGDTDPQVRRAAEGAINAIRKVSP